MKWLLTFIIKLLTSPNKFSTSTGFPIFGANCAKPLLRPLNQILGIVAILQHFFKSNEIILKVRDVVKSIIT